MLDDLDELGDPALTIGCRSAHCGHCLVHVEGGTAGVAAAGSSERQTLAELGIADTQPQARLGCQLVLTGEADVHITPMRSSAQSATND